MFRNTLAQAARLITMQGFSFVLAPIMISQLGLTVFGVWAIVGAIIAYASVLDAGITRALARFIALYDAQGAEKSIRECATLGFIAFTVIGVLLFPLAWLAGPLLSDQLGVLSTGQMRSVLFASSTIFLVQGYSAVLQALAHGLRRMVPPNIAVIAGSCVNFGFSVGALLTSGSLVTYAWANAIAEAITLVFVLISAVYVWRKSMFAVPRRERVGEILSFSVRSQLGWVADLVNLQTDKIVLGLIVGPTAAGVYQIGSSVAIAVRTMGIITLSAMIPTATAAMVEEGPRAIRRFFQRYMPLTLGLAMPMFVIGALTAPFLLHAWMGDLPTGDAVGVLIVLCVAYGVNFVTGVPSTLSISEGKPGFVSVNAIQMAGLNVVLTFALAPWFGLSGVVAGTVISMSLLSTIFVVRFARQHDLSARDVRVAVAPATILAVAVAVPLIPLVVVLWNAADSRLTAAALLIGMTAAYVFVYWPLASRAEVLPERLKLRTVRRMLVARGREA